MTRRRWRFKRLPAAVFTRMSMSAAVIPPLADGSNGYRNQAMRIFGGPTVGRGRCLLHGSPETQPVTLETRSWSGKTLTNIAGPVSTSGPHLKWATSASDEAAEHAATVRTAPIATRPLPSRCQVCIAIPQRELPTGQDHAAMSAVQRRISRGALSLPDAGERRLLAVPYPRRRISRSTTVTADAERRRLHGASP